MPPINNGNITEEPSPGRGQYDEKYVTQQSIGKGAFGFVKLAQRKTDGLSVNNYITL
jgi:PAS domain-containing serine/threonine kinase